MVDSGAHSTIDYRAYSDLFRLTAHLAFSTLHYEHIQHDPDICLDLLHHLFSSKGCDGAHIEHLLNPSTDLGKKGHEHVMGAISSPSYHLLKSYSSKTKTHGQIYRP
jgi:hypothetical protein